MVESDPLRVVKYKDATRYVTNPETPFIIEKLVPHTQQRAFFALALQPDYGLYLTGGRY